MTNLLSAEEFFQIWLSVKWRKKIFAEVENLHEDLIEKYKEYCQSGESYAVLFVKKFDKKIQPKYPQKNIQQRRGIYFGLSGDYLGNLLSG